MKVINLLNANAELQHSARKLYEDSFPIYERRSWETQLRAANDENAHCSLVMSDDDVFLAILFYWTYDNGVYGEHLAVNPMLRGQNVGTLIVSHLIEENKGKAVIIEIDPPQDEISIRRLHFYERIGFVPNQYKYIHPSYVTGEKAYPHELSILSYGAPVNQKIFDEFIEFMRDVVLSYVD